MPSRTMTTFMERMRQMAFRGPVHRPGPQGPDYSESPEASVEIRNRHIRQLLSGSLGREAIRGYWHDEDGLFERISDVAIECDVCYKGLEAVVLPTISLQNGRVEYAKGSP